MRPIQSQDIKIALVLLSAQVIIPLMRCLALCCCYRTWTSRGSGQSLTEQYKWRAFREMDPQFIFGLPISHLNCVAPCSQRQDTNSPFSMKWWRHGAMQCQRGFSPLIEIWTSHESNQGWIYGPQQRPQIYELQIGSQPAAAAVVVEGWLARKLLGGLGISSPIEIWLDGGNYSNRSKSGSRTGTNFITATE